MNKELKEYIQYHIARAKESHEEAAVLAASEHWNGCVNRLYYACFYAVSALLSNYDLSSSKHSGIRAIFNQRFVKTGIISKDISVIYNSLFERRQESDYEVFFVFKESDVKPWLDETNKFVTSVIKTIELDTEKS